MRVYGLQSGESFYISKALDGEPLASSDSFCFGVEIVGMWHSLVSLEGAEREGHMFTRN